MVLAPKQLGKTAEISDLNTGGAVTVTGRIEQYRAITIEQDTAGQTITLPSPVDTAIVFTVDVVNTGTNAFSFYGKSVTPGTSTSATWSGSAWTVSPAPTVAASGSLVEWQTATTYAIGDSVYDPNTLTLFVALTAHTSAATPPSQDPVNWQGLDRGLLGQVTIGMPALDRHGYLAMTPGRTVSRAQYNRLMEAIAPELVGNSIVSGSTLLGLGPANSVYANVGYTVEGTGITPGTTIVSVSPQGEKVGSNLATGNVINWRTGVLAAGYSIPANTEVVGGGLGAAATTQSAGSTPDSTVSINNGVVGLGANFIAGLTTYTHSQILVAGDYVSHAAFPVDTRVTRFQNRVVSTGTQARTETGSPFIALTPAFESIVDLTNTTAPMVGRRISGTGIPANASVISVAKPTYQTITVGNWDWVSTIGFFSPWDVDPADEGEAVTPYVRRMSGGPVTDAVAASIVSVQASGSALAGTLSGETGLFWRTGVTLPAVTNNLKVGSATPGIATDTYLTVGVVGPEESVNIGTLNAVPRIFYASGAPQVGVEGRYVTRLDVGINQARITGTPVAQFNRTSSSITNGDDKLHLQSGSINANHVVGQFISGAGIPANTRITAFDPETAVSNSFWLAASALFSVQPGEAQTFVVGQRVTGTGRAPGSANAITAILPEVTRQCVGLPNSSNVFFEPGESVAEVKDRQILGSAGWAPNTYLLGMVDAVAGAPTQAGVYMSTGSNNAFYPSSVSAIPAAAVVNGGVKFAGSEPGFTYSRITATNGPLVFRAAIASGTNVAYIAPQTNATPLSTSNNYPTVTAGRGATIGGSGISGGRFGTIVPATSSDADWNGVGTGAGGSGVITVTNWGGRPLTAGDVGMYVGAIVSSSARFGRITTVLSPTSFQVFSTENVTYLTANQGTFIGPRVTIVDDAGGPINASSSVVPFSNMTSSLPGTNGTMAPFLTLATAATATGAAAMDVLGYISAVSPAGASTTPVGNALFTGPVTFGARYQLSGTSTAANNFGTATVGAMVTMSNNATATSTTLTATFGRWADITVPATADSLPAPTVLGNVSTMSTPATATLDGETVGWGAYIAAPPASSQPTTRGSIANIKFGGVLELSANGTSQSFPEVTFGMIIETDQVSTAASTAAFTIGGHTAIDVSNVSDAVDATYSFGVGITMSAPATATDPNVAIRLFPHGAGDGSTTFGVGSGPVSLGGVNRTPVIYAGA